MNKFVRRTGLVLTRGSLQSLIRSPKMSNHRGKKKRVVETDAEPEPTITSPKQKIDIAAYIASLAEKDELLDIVPCENGIASAGI